MNPKGAFCTIIAKNYLASARTLCASLCEFHPSIPRHVLFIDGYHGAINPADEPFEAISLEEIGLDDLDRLCFSYDVVELATVVKPHLLKYLLKRFQLSELVYLDPDTMVLNSLSGLFEAISNCNLILTPHLDADFPDDGHRPNTATILTHGLYNLGFLVIKNSVEALRFLDWWDVTIRTRCTRDYSTAHYVDQKVVDLAPLLFGGVHLETGPGYNVAYWNIHNRRIRFADGRWFSNNQPLSFFHFSGFDPEKPDALSRDCTRPLSEENSDLLVLLHDYRDRLVRNGYVATGRPDYGHARFVNGEQILYTTRQYFRASEALQSAESTPFRSPRMIRRNRWEAFKSKRPTVSLLIYKIWRASRLPIKAFGRSMRSSSKAPWIGIG